jgi:hypothetical protein
MFEERMTENLRQLHDELKGETYQPRPDPGIPKGRDFQRWPNAFFGNHKLFSLKTAHELACRSSSR